MAASLALYNNNIDPRNTPIACEDLERKALTWTCFTAEMFSVSLSDDVWKLLSFGGVTAGSEPLVLTEVPGQPQVLDKDSFRAYFEQRTGGWECSIAAGSILVVTMVLMARRCLNRQLDCTGQAVFSRPARCETRWQGCSSDNWGRPSTPSPRADTPRPRF